MNSFSWYNHWHADYLLLLLCHCIAAGECDLCVFAALMCVDLVCSPTAVRAGRLCLQGSAVSYVSPDAPHRLPLYVHWVCFVFA